MYEKSAVEPKGGGAETGESNDKGGDTLNSKDGAKIGNKGRDKRDTEGDNGGETKAGDNGKYSSDDIMIANPKDCKVEESHSSLSPRALCLIRLICHKVCVVWVSF